MSDSGSNKSEMCEWLHMNGCGEDSMKLLNRLKEGRRTLVHNYDDISKTLRDANNHIIKLESKINELSHPDESEKIETLQSQVDALELELGKTKRRNKDLLEANKWLSDKIKELQEDNMSLSAKNSRLSDDIVQLKSSMAERMTERMEKKQEERKQAEQKQEEQSEDTWRQDVASDIELAEKLITNLLYSIFN